MNGSDEIFLLKANNLEPLSARTMREGLLGETLEAALQRFFEKYPEVIPGKQIDPGSSDPPRFILLRREMPIGSWSLDHLFVDQRGVLTLVETKLFQNPESRREVIGQIVEYAANAADVWSKGQARQKASEYWEKKGGNVDDILKAQLLDEEPDVNEFWNRVERNLEDGTIRLIIATDELRPEVRKMIEYLNREMEHAEILGLEIKFYGKDPESCVLVPRLVGQTQSTSERKGSSSKRTIEWTTEMLGSAYDEMADRSLAQRLKSTLAWAMKENIFMSTQSYNPVFGLRELTGKRLVSFSSDGMIYAYLSYPNQDGYLGGIEGRVQYVKVLKGLNLLDPELDLTRVVNGRVAKRKLQDLADNEYSQLLNILAKLCKGQRDDWLGQEQRFDPS